LKRHEVSKYDVIVIGADMPVRGRAGLRPHGLRTAMITMNLDLIAQMSCNPAVVDCEGSPGARIDALGGYGEVTDAVGIQFRLLNTSAAGVWSPRAQCDKKQYRFRMREVWKPSRI